MSPAGRERRQALIEAAYVRIAKIGLEGLRLRDLAGEVGIDHSSIHHYFPTKQHLIEAVVEFATRPFWSTTPSEGGPIDRLVTHLDRLAQRIVEDPARHRVLRELDLRAMRDPAVRAIIADREQRWRASLTDIISSGVQAQALAEGVTVEGAVELIVATVKGASLRPDSARDVFRELLALLAPSRRPPACAGRKAR